MEKELTLTVKEALPGLTFDDNISKEPVLEAESMGQTFFVSPEVFRSWTGRRFFNGIEVHGPIYNLNTNVKYEGSRACNCAKCQADVQPRYRKN